MLRPMLIIGVGGSGGKTIRSMISALERRLLSARYEGGIPAAWQFLQIDTTYDGVNFPAPMLDADKFHSVVPSGSNFSSILDGIVSRGTLPDQQLMMSGWGIPTSAINIAMGAGQTRAIGRQAGVADSARTVKAIQTSIAKMSAPTAQAELMSVAKALDASAPVSQVPQAFIISSIAGGSGAGMFIDVAELLKRSTDEKWAGSAISFLYTAEVFNSLGAAGANVAKNSLGAMNEIMAGKWVSVSERSEILYQKLGLAPSGQQSKEEFGAKGNILIGSRNKTGVDISIGADGAGMDEVFLTIGEALAGALTIDEISEYFYQVAFVNITETRAAIDSSGMSPRDPANPTFAAAGIGFGQMSLGADRIVDYVADALTKRQVVKLLWPELNQELLKDGVTSVSLIKNKADEIWPTFLLESGLDEQGAQDQIIESLFPEGWKDDVIVFAKKLVRDSVSKEAKPLGRFAEATWSEWETETDEFLKTIREKINNNARSWVPSIQNKLRERIAIELMQNGFAVVSDLVARLQKEIVEYALPELIREHEKDASSVKNFDKAAYNNRVKEYAEGLTGVSDQNGAFLDKVVSIFKRVLDGQINSHVHNLAASLIQDMSKHYFEPLREELANSRFKLLTQQAMTVLPDGKKNNFSNFPDWGSGIIHSRYKPRTIERILIEITDYESTFETYAGRDSGANASFSLSIGASLLGRKINPMPGEPNPQKLISENVPWSTSVRDAQDAMGSALTKLVWSIQTDLASLGERNRQWLKDEKSSFGKFTSMSIREFVAAEGLPPEERSNRETKFVNEYQAMLSLSQPLISLNDNAMKYIKAASDGKSADQVLPKSSKIPFDASSSIGVSCTAILGGLGISVTDGSFASTWFDPGSKRTTMYATATTQASLPAWAFASLTDPILEQAAESKLNGAVWAQFWEGRRARPLIEAVPFEAEMRRSIITGWFLASIFGLRDISVHAAGRAVKLWNPILETPGWSAFPDPLLDTHPEDARRGNWLLPAVLTSGGLALCEFGRTGKMEIIHPYLLLKYLGREVTTKLTNRDEWDQPGGGDLLPTGIMGISTFVEDWVRSGTKPAKERELLEILEAQLANGGDRVTALLAVIQELREQYSSAWGDFDRTVWHKLPHTWELKEDIDLALSDIYNYVSDLHIVTVRTGA